ncbi:MAG TPA: bifunctional 4-hydroxy-2-oxoglutarate aldolase/2-dehydro-3-deoxy-phosphogluconate aldolase [Terracidiphilus sp.]|nr:bifunctional 4-hydroxy-2-oxoglutarate aldolase/2-dehydro-3-deoxy-phosphogluconate aldolase [Terracidiphilus sp.]
MTREEAKARLEKIGILPGVRVNSAAEALYAAETVYQAGIPVAEITMTVPNAVNVIKQLVQRLPDMIVGAGTVLDGETARRCVDAGALFLTSPGLVPDVVACALKASVLAIPGALTPTEVIAAWRAGGDFVKIFPAAPMGGDQYLRSLKVPLPQVPLIAAGGVNQQTAAGFLRAGASVLGVGMELLPNDAVRRREDHRIHELARRFLGFVAEARAQG